ncbi:MAG: heparinase II/III family protein [Acidobacteriota bacterium]|nr:heparinase II/III family protein [Acidobacteriota bacterium]
MDKLKKLKGRSLKEFQTRGGQAMLAYSEKLGIRGKLLADDEFLNVISPGAIDPSLGISAESLRDKFYANSNATFFPSISNLEESVRLLCDHLKGRPDRYFIEQADKIIEGRIDLLGFRNLDFGTPIDWHYEPVSETHCPIKHWKQFDEADSRETGDKKIIWELNRHRHFFTLGVSYRISGNEKYAACFAEHLNSWMDQNPPGIGVNWVSSLEVAFRVMSWLWAFHLFRDSKAFTTDLFFDALKFLFAQGRHIEKYLSTYYSPNTHLTGEALGLFYLGTQLSFFDRAEHWRALGEEILTAELERQVRPDGIYFEQSTWYQRYTTDFYTHFLILQKLNGSRLSSGQHRKMVSVVRSLLDSQLLFTRPDGTSPLIGDDDGGTMLPVTTDRPDDFRSSLATGAVIFERGDYKLIAEESKQGVLWLLGPKGLAVFESIGEHAPSMQSKGFKSSGFYVMRDGWSKEDNYLLIDAGEVGSLNGGHGHADTLAIELAVGGRTMLVDPGTYTYHKSLEQRNCYRSSPAHNTLTIDDKSSSEFGGTFSWDAMADAEVDSWISQDRFDFIEARHNGYRRLENSPADCTRSILFLKNDYWIMRDFVKTVGEHQYQQNFHFDTGTNPTIVSPENGIAFVEAGEGEREGMRLFTFGDNGSWQRKDGWISKCYGQRQNAPFIRFVSKGIGPQEFLTFIIPVEPGFERPKVLETEVAGGRAFVVNYRNYQDLFVFADGGMTVRTEFFNTDFAFLWARISAGEKLPEEFVLINGRNFTLNGREVLNNPENFEFATARRFGSRLNVRTSKSVFSVSIPQKNSRTFIVKSTPEVDI